MRILSFTLGVSMLLTPLAAVAQSFYENSPLVCTQLEGEIRGERRGMMPIFENLDELTQIHPLGNYRASSDILREYGQGYCTYNYNIPSPFDQLTIGWLDAGDYWVEVALVRNILTMRPRNIYRKSEWRPTLRCLQYRGSVRGSTLYGYSEPTKSKGLVRGCEYLVRR